MQDVAPHVDMQRPRSQDEIALDRIAEIALRAWISARKREPLTRRTFRCMCERVRSTLVPKTPAARLLKCHDALWRRAEGHPAAKRRAKTYPHAYTFAAKKLPLVGRVRAYDFGELYELFVLGMKNNA